MIQNFYVNSLNELTTATNSGKLTVVGTTTSIATNVTVNTTNALRYNDATFAATNMPLASTYTAIALDSKGRKGTNIVTVNLSTNCSYAYDQNGNLTNDGLRSFAYDDENQLISVLVAGAWKSDFAYDGKMRRRIRTEYSATGTNWVKTNEVHYIYDRLLVVQERDVNNLPLVSYTRGIDIRGGLQRAGGIGGLLARTRNGVIEDTGDGGAPAHAFFHADGNGNITMLMNSSQIPVAKYLYDAFGNTLSKSGPLADANLYRFSSKEWHQNSCLAYYLYRNYDPNLQRWINQDPEGEFGGINLFEFVSENPLTEFDSFGLQRGTAPGPPPPGPDTCDPDKRKQADDALKNACDQLNNACPSNDNCRKLIDTAKKACNNGKGGKTRCAKPGDKDCKGGDACAYESYGQITLCPSAWPADGSNCPGIGGNINLQCIMIHELEHAGANEKNQDDANALQKCLGCPQGQPHAKD